ncbi:similar to Tigger transposable element-derived protein 6 [Ectocarpus siliculosus]|uniref:Similar to Tigger transposable element-derived protein 6, partial n=1 Tax=Ectocarpus siliculosus TaxID=2880 RepID=D7G3D6_ECTSI|nr:similar to Tigger transposable element-derived protein 6 [Ectocarpus siliculosus]|eukprot:CBJ33530.1 similar to Tigger transposable element-derived protein 6 [Ectocarpus siliculosus]
MPSPQTSPSGGKVRHWFQVARERFKATKIGVSGSMVQVRATKIAAQMNKTDFKATNGWLHRFLKRYNYTHVKLHGEAGDVDTAKVAEEIEQIREQHKEFDVEFIFNMDETGLFYRCFPRVPVQDGDGDQAGGPHRRLGHRPCTKDPKGLPGPQ